MTEDALYLSIKKGSIVTPDDLLAGAKHEMLGAKKVRERKSKKSDDLVAGLKAFYGEPEAETVEIIEPVFETEAEIFDLLDLETIPDDFLTFEKQLETLDAQVEMSPETRAELEKTQDIGLILAIIEAVD